MEWFICNWSEFGGNEVKVTDESDESIWGGKGRWDRWWGVACKWNSCWLNVWDAVNWIELFDDDIDGCEFDCSGVGGNDA